MVDNVGQHVLRQGPLLLGAWLGPELGLGLGSGLGSVKQRTAAILEVGTPSARNMAFCDGAAAQVVYSVESVEYVE